MSFKSFLSAAVHDFGVVFRVLGSSKGQAAILSTEAAANIVIGSFNPGLALALEGVEKLVNGTLQKILAAETAATVAGAQSGSGPQKAAAVIASISSDVADILKAAGVSNPTAEQVQTVATAVNNGLVAVLNVIPAPAA